jgi:uncharacterized protein YbaA (DUF1428 family)
MPRYVDGFLIPIRKSKVPAYRKLARKAGRIWRELGALEYRECVLNDQPKGLVRFASAARARAGEVVLFSWIVYRSKAHRDRVNARVMKDPRIAAMNDPALMPFDLKRMAYAGFEVLVDL